MQAKRIGREAAVLMHMKRRQREYRLNKIRRRFELVFGGATLLMGLLALWLFWVMTPSGMVK